jgi:hypothetical protein
MAIGQSIHSVLRYFLVTTKRRLSKVFLDRRRLCLSKIPEANGSKKSAELFYRCTASGEAPRHGVHFALIDKNDQQKYFLWSKSNTPFGGNDIYY